MNKCIKLLMYSWPLKLQHYITLHYIYIRSNVRVYNVDHRQITGYNHIIKIN